ncbi:MAG: hypothetical protein AAF950_12085 [Pseudomonadota bacterium]
MADWLEVKPRAALCRLTILALPLFGLWLVLSAHVFVPVAVSVQSLWLTPAYRTYEPRIVKTEGEKHWKIETNLFRAGQAYPHGAYRPGLQLDRTSSINLEYIQPLTLSLLIFWLVHLSLSPLSWSEISRQGEPLLTGSLQLFGIFMLLVAAKIFVGLGELMTAGDGLMRSFYLDTILVPRQPPLWLLDLLKPIIDASVFFLILVLPVALCVTNWSKDATAMETKHSAWTTAV